MEYPGLIFISSGDSAVAVRGSANRSADRATRSPTSGSTASSATTRSDPWLDEAFASYLPYYYYRRTMPDQADGTSFPAGCLGRAGRPSPSGRDLPVDASIDELRLRSALLRIVYRQGAAFLDELRNAVGDSAFEAAIGEIVSTFADKIASPRAVLEIFQHNTSVNLNPLIGRYFSYPSSKPLARE